MTTSWLVPFKHVTGFLETLAVMQLMTSSLSATQHSLDEQLPDDRLHFPCLLKMTTRFVLVIIVLFCHPGLSFDLHLMYFEYSTLALLTCG